MRDPAPFRIGSRVRSVGYALAGIALMLRGQHNAWLHLAATVVVVALGWAVELARLEWALIALAIALVWAAEALNTAFELLCDVANPEFHPLVKGAKDVAAGAVLISAIGAAAVGALVFAPYLFR